VRKRERAYEMEGRGGISSRSGARQNQRVREQFGRTLGGGRGE